MKHKVSELEGNLLDAAVAKAEGHTAPIDGRDVVCMWRFDGSFSPSRAWADGGPILERDPWLLPYRTPPHRYHLGLFSSETPGGFFYHGATPLIAAMRAHVASKFGEEVELP